MEPKKIFLPDLKSETRFDSDLNGVIRIKMFGDDIRAMIFGETETHIQSLYDTRNLETIYLPYINPLLTFLNHVEKFDNILFIGLGGGHVPMLISQKFDTKIDIVELDPAVVTAAEYMGFQQSDKMNVMVGDGAALLSLTLKQYDVIVIDLDKPESFDHFNFAEIKLGRLSNNGVLVINCGEHDGKEILSEKLGRLFTWVRLYGAFGQFVYICKIIPDYFYDGRITDKMKEFSNWEQIMRESK